MYVYDMKGQMVDAGPGIAGPEAEATVSVDGGKDVYVHAWHFEGCCGYTVSEKSFFGHMNDEKPYNEEDCVESYDELGDAKKSAYYGVFKVLNQMMRLMEGD